jgi:hypothetical protein
MAEAEVGAGASPEDGTGVTYVWRCEPRPYAGPVELLSRMLSRILESLMGPRSGALLLAPATLDITPVLAARSGGSWAPPLRSLLLLSRRAG